MMRFLTFVVPALSLALSALACDQSCEDGGRTYDDGAAWTCSDGCNTCSCHDGTVTSTAAACVGEPGPAAGKLLCKGSGQTYRHGESIVCEQACGDCTCDDGEIVPDCDDDAPDGG